MRGQKIGFKHSEQSKAAISLKLKGRAPLAIHIKKNCPTCGVSMGVGNLGRHAPACAAKAASGLFPEKTTFQLKKMRTRLRAYGITPLDFSQSLQKQGGVCAICGGDKRGRQLSVDHNHRSGKVRGLLCSDCNILLGCAHDKIQVLRRAIQYLEINGEIEPDSCESIFYNPWKD